MQAGWALLQLSFDARTTAGIGGKSCQIRPQNHPESERDGARSWPIREILDTPLMGYNTLLSVGIKAES